MLSGSLKHVPGRIGKEKKIMDIKICPSCGKKNSASDVCCTGCFTVLTGVKAVSQGGGADNNGAAAGEKEKKIRCRVCGSENSAEAEKCRFCGSRLYVSPVTVAEGDGWKCRFCGCTNSFELHKCARCAMPFVKESPSDRGIRNETGSEMQLPWAFSSEKLPLKFELIHRAFEKIINSPYLKRIPERWAIARAIECFSEKKDEYNAYATMRGGKPKVFVYSEFLRVTVAVCAGYLTGIRGEELLEFIRKAYAGHVTINGEIIQQSLDSLTESYLTHVLAHEIGHHIKRHLLSPHLTLENFCRNILKAQKGFDDLSAEAQNKVIEMVKGEYLEEYSRIMNLRDREEEREADMEAIQIIREIGMPDFFLEGQLLEELTMAAADPITVEQSLAMGTTHPASIERLRTFLESNRLELEKSLVTRQELQVYMKFAGTEL